MIIYVIGNLFQSPTRVLVNPVNTSGVMGKGIPGMFKRLYPEMFEAYRALCERQAFEIGHLWLYRTAHKWILNLPTKTHWRASAKIETIEMGLQKFASVYAEMGITAVSFPAFSDGLRWDDEVRPLMEAYLDPLPVAVYIHMYDPDTAQHTRTLAAWLHGKPSDISFDKVWRDLARILRQGNTFETTATGELFHAALDNRPRSRSLTLHTAAGDFYYSEMLLADLWSYVRGAGYCLPQNLPGGLDASADYIIPVFTTLDYVRPVKLYTAGGRMQHGMHYVPPADRTAAKTMTLEPIYADRSE